MALDSGDFCLIDREVVDKINSLPEKNRFVRGLRSWVGYNQVPVYYNRQKRQAGKPKYTIAKLLSEQNHSITVINIIFVD